MKLVQLARPLFLIALGLHALVLFLPTGGGSEAVVVEDVPFSEESASTRTPLKTPVGEKTIGESPERSPAASTETLVAAGRKPPKPATLSPTAVATRAAMPSATRTQAARTQATGNQAARTNQPAPSSSDGIPNLPAGDTSDAQSNPQSNPQTSPASPQNNASASATDTLPPSRPSTSSIPDLTSRDNRPATAADVDALPSINRLIANLAESVSVPQDLLKEISDLSESLAYSEENTDERSANQNRIDWEANIQRQANVGTVETIEPTAISDLTEITYPIEAPKQMDVRSLSLCLEKPPHNAEVGVLFDSQGNVAGEPSLIRSTGYEALNDEIIATIRSYEDFPPNRNSKAYLIAFEVDYDADTCVSLEALKE